MWNPVCSGFKVQLASEVLGCWQKLHLVQLYNGKVAGRRVEELQAIFLATCAKQVSMQLIPQ